MRIEKMTMRDAFLEELHSRMRKDKNIFFLCADFGSPKLDRIRADFPDRFINVGIAEQNLINIATGLALEGYCVFVYAIAPFLVMRPFEQIRVNLSLQAQLRPININLIGVGAGLSYDVSGPTHHCLEDIALIRALPNIELFSPSDWVLAREFVSYSIEKKSPKYLRFDGKPQPCLYEKPRIRDGFSELKKGKRVCLVSTGYMTQRAMRIQSILSREGIDAGVIDVFLLKPLAEKKLFSALNKYKAVITLEEAFINKGGFDCAINGLLIKNNRHPAVKSFGFQDKYVFDIGSREHLHNINKMSDLHIIRTVKELLKKIG